jgi:hypothetical protein
MWSFKATRLNNGFMAFLPNLPSHYFQNPAILPSSETFTVRRRQKTALSGHFSGYPLSGRHPGPPYRPGHSPRQRASASRFIPCYLLSDTPLPHTYCGLSLITPQYVVYPGRPASFPKQHVLFPRKNAPFTRENGAFTRENESFTRENGPFTIGNVSFLKRAMHITGIP